jgi:hypothetical protein
MLHSTVIYNGLSRHASYKNVKVVACRQYQIGDTCAGGNRPAKYRILILPAFNCQDVRRCKPYSPLSSTFLPRYVNADCLKSAAVKKP